MGSCTYYEAQFPALAASERAGLRCVRIGTGSRCRRCRVSRISAWRFLLRAINIDSKQKGCCGPKSPRKASCEVNLVQSSLTCHSIPRVPLLQLGSSVSKGVEGMRLSQPSQTIHSEVVNRLSAQHEVMCMAQLDGGSHTHLLYRAAAQRSSTPAASRNTFNQSCHETSPIHRRAELENLYPMPKSRDT